LDTIAIEIVGELIEELKVACIAVAAGIAPSLQQRLFLIQTQILKNE